MNTRLIYRLAILSLVVLLLVSVISAAAASNTVPSTRLTDQNRPITVNDIKPAQCTMTLAGPPILCTGGTCTGTNSNDLILGSSGADNISGGKGDDCILGGGGNDFFKGDQGTDVCIGGPGTDTFHPSCETQIQ
jgi:hypothetical protein